jgi:hypothetical protein
VATDVCSGWTEAAALVAREQSLVVDWPDLIPIMNPNRCRRRSLAITDGPFKEMNFSIETVALVDGQNDTILWRLPESLAAMRAPASTFSCPCHGSMGRV